MTDINWGLIRSGATFESLVTSLLFFQDSRASLFGRPGRDDGQDARSGDGATVYQAKFHKNESSAKVIFDAKEEARKLKKRIQHAGKGKDVWDGVKHWVLVTNATFNSRDEERWKNEIEPLFQDLGLTADYWEQAKLDGMLSKYPEVYRTYFEGENRVFLSLQEACSALSSLNFDLRALDATFQGRSKQFSVFREFLTDDEKRILLVHGPSGIGKSRFLLEAAWQAATDWLPLWALVASMTHSNSWFEGIPNRASLILVDEPEDERLLSVLIEQISSRTGKWKAVITTRSPNDSVLRGIHDPKRKNLVQTLELQSLADKESRALSEELLSCDELTSTSEEWKKRATTWAETRFNGYPVWIAMACQLLVRGGESSDMPETSADLAKSYFDKIVDAQSGFSRNELLSVLRWVSLLQPFNRETQDEMDFVQDQAKLDNSLSSCLTLLIDQQVLYKRGARSRLVELKPDVLAEYVQRDWLIEEASYGNIGPQPSGSAKELVAMLIKALHEKTFASFDRRVLVSLLKLEYLQKNSGIKLLDGFIGQIRNDLGKFSARQQMALFDALHTIGPVRPNDVLDVVNDLLCYPPETETYENILGRRSVSSWDVLLQLAWTTFSAGVHIETSTGKQRVLALLGKIATGEEKNPEGKTLPNDGKRANRLFLRLLQDAPTLEVPYDDEALDLVIKELQATASGRAAQYPWPFIKGASKHLLSIYRNYSTSNATSITLHKFAIRPQSPEWKRRTTLIDEIRTLLRSNTTNSDAVPNLLQLLVEESLATRGATLYLPPETLNTNGLCTAIDQQERTSLEWMAIYLERPQKTPIEHLRIASKIWNWLLKLENNTELQQLAQRCQAILDSNEIYEEFESLLTWDPQRHLERNKKKASELAKLDATAINAFVQRLTEYLKDDEHPSRASGVGFELGKLAPEVPSIQQFVESALREGSYSSQFIFAMSVSRGWVFAIRAENAECAGPHLEKQLSVLTTPVAKTVLLKTVFENTFFSATTDREISVFLQHRQDFIATNQVSDFFGIAGSFVFRQWDEVTDDAEAILSELDEKHLQQAISSLVHSMSMYARALKEETNQTVKLSQVRWLLDQVLLVPDIDSLGHNTFLNVKDMLEISGPLPALWLAEAVEFRLNNYSKSENQFRILPNHERLSAFVDPCNESGATPEQKELVVTLVDKLGQNSELDYVLPEYLTDLDPHGVILPCVVVTAIESVSLKIQELWKLGKLAGTYAQNSKPWRIIALCLLKKAANLPGDGLERVMSSLVDPRPRTWSGAIGEVSSVFYSAVDTAQKRFDDETEEVLLLYWQTRLDQAVASLQYEKEQLKEEGEE